MLFLCADSSGSSICFTLSSHENNVREIISTVQIHTGGKNSELFFPELARFLAGVVMPDGSKITASDIDTWIAVTGPGSFTGIRICLAGLTAVSIAYGKPLRGISSLDAAALLSGKERINVAARLRMKEYASKRFDFISGVHSGIVVENLHSMQDDYIFINDGHSDINLTLALADDRFDIFLTDAAPIYVKRSEAEINFDKKCFN